MFIDEEIFKVLFVENILFLMASIISANGIIVVADAGVNIIGEKLANIQHY